MRAGLKRVFAIASASAVLAIALPATSAQAFAVCNRPNKPEYDASYEKVNYDGTGKCTGANLDTWRVRIGLAEEEVNTGPIPNDWNTIGGSYTAWSTWAVPGATRARGNAMYCSDLQQNWQHKSRFHTQADWDDGDVTEAYGDSAEVRVC